MVTAKKMGLTDYVLSNRLVLFNLRLGITVLFWGMIVAILALIARSVMIA